MGRFLDIRQKIAGMFIRNEIFLIPLIKFLTMMAVLLLMNWHLGYRYMLMRWILVILVSLISALLPWSGITALAAVYLVGHVSALTWEGTAILAVFFLGAALAQYLFLPGAGFLVMLTPLAFYLKIPYLVPLLAGLFGSGAAFLPVGEGVILYYLMLCLEKNAPIFNDPAGSIITNLLQILNGMNNQQMYLMLIAFCVATLAVYGTRRLHMDYMYLISVAVGGFLMLLAIILGRYALNLPMGLGGIVLGCVFATLIAALVSAWVWVLDYSAVEYLEYEDDEYVYYVKAVPKLQIAEPLLQVHEIAEEEEEEYEPEVPEAAYFRDE